jgi:alkylation response protein AidB-like acyl-CoA dehydrogenase
METLVPPALAASAPERARAVQALLDTHGPEMDRRRELTPEVVDALAGQDLLRMLRPKSMGGQETPLVEYCKACEAIAWADASSAWFVNQSNVSAATSAASMPYEAAAAMFAGPHAGLAWGARHNNSSAVRVEGGYRLTGAWSFASGGRHTKWLGAHSAVQNADGTPHIRYGRPDDRSFLFLREQATIIDDWHVLGLRGTGSDSYSVTDLFVPDDYSLHRDPRVRPRVAGKLYVFTQSTLYAPSFAGIAFGIARAFIDAFVADMKDTTPRGASRTRGENHVIQSTLGQSEARLRSARTYLLSEVASIWEDAQRQEVLTTDQLMRLRMASTWGIQSAKQVVQDMYTAVGALAIFDIQPFERRFRDIHTVTQQFQGQPAHFETVGQVLLGREPDRPMFTF